MKTIVTLYDSILKINYKSNIMQTNEQSRWDNCVKMMNINCKQSITLCHNSNHNILPCNPDKGSIKSQTGPMRIFHTLNERYIKWNIEDRCALCFETWLVVNLVV